MEQRGWRTSRATRERAALSAVRSEERPALCAASLHEPSDSSDQAVGRLRRDAGRNLAIAAPLALGLGRASCINVTDRRVGRKSPDRTCRTWRAIRAGCRVPGTRFKLRHAFRHAQVCRASPLTGAAWAGKSGPHDHRVPCVKRFGRARSVRGAKTAVAVAPIVQGRNASRAESGSLLISTLHCVDRSRREQAEDRTQR